LKKINIFASNLVITPICLARHRVRPLQGRCHIIKIAKLKGIIKLKSELTDDHVIIIEKTSMGTRLTETRIKNHNIAIEKGIKKIILIILKN
jgi:hypothetical protein